MPRLTSLAVLGCILAGCLTWLATAADAPPQGPPDAPPAKPDDRGPDFGPPRFGPPPFALMEALDSDGDGTLSADEIKAAVQVLRKLDKNQDRKLDAEELGWPPRFPGMPGGGPPFGPGGPGASNRSFAQRLLARDANGDGRITKDELPSSMQFLIQRGDRNHDGALEAHEVQRLAEELGLPAPQPASGK